MSKVKISLNDIRLDYYRIKKEVPSYRYGQHFCNVLGLRDTTLNGTDLFQMNSKLVVDVLICNLCDLYHWDMQDLPIFGEYDISTIKPC